MGRPEDFVADKKMREARTDRQRLAVLHAASRLDDLGREVNAFISPPSDGAEPKEPIPFQLKHIRYLVSESGQEVRVDDAPENWAKEQRRPSKQLQSGVYSAISDAAMKNRFDRINDEILGMYDGKSPFPKDATRGTVQNRVNELVKMGALTKKVEDGYLYVSNSLSVLRATYHIKQMIQGDIEQLIRDEKRPRLLHSDGLTASLGYGLPDDLSSDQKDRLDEAVSKLREARQIVSEDVLEQPGHFLLAVWGCTHYIRCPNCMRKNEGAAEVCTDCEETLEVDDPDVVISAPPYP